MNSLLVLGFALFAVASALPRSKREAYDLPDGAEILVANIKTSFQCPDNALGYYADVDNNCNIFHICHPVVDGDGSSKTLQFSFLCGNQTIFNQFSLTCSYPEEAVPCSSARDFFYLNDNIRAGDPDVPLHTDQDVERARALILRHRK